MEDLEGLEEDLRMLLGRLSALEAERVALRSENATLREQEPGGRGWGERAVEGDRLERESAEIRGRLAAAEGKIREMVRRIDVVLGE